MNNYIKQIQTEHNEVFLTFDDGPNPFHTPAVLDILKEEGVKATFFVIGSRVAAYPDIVKRMVAEGHVVAGHTYTHGGEKGDLSWGDFIEGNKCIEKITNIKVHAVRVPQFAYSAIDTVCGNKIPRIIELTQGELKQQINSENMYVIDCSINPQDWNRWVPSWYIRSFTLRSLHPGAIICLHDGSEKESELKRRPKRTLRILRTLVRETLKKGYVFSVLNLDTLRK